MTGLQIDADLIVRSLLEAEDDPDAWIGVDLDGTLAKYDGWKGATKIGEPIPKMVSRIRRWVGHGKKVKIFTARADDERSVNAIKKWLKQHELPDLEITNLKDEHMTKLWDDRAVAVEKNTGEVKESDVDQIVRHVLAESDEASFHGTTHWGCGHTSNCRCSHPTHAARTLPEDCPMCKAGVTKRLTESPEIKTLKDHQQSLDPEERAQVMKAGAVWHHGKDGAASPAVKKATVNGKTWYWCATHRAGRVCPTLKGAIKAFDFVKTTS